MSVNSTKPTSSSMENSTFESSGKVLACGATIITIKVVKSIGVVKSAASAGAGGSALIAKGAVSAGATGAGGSGILATGVSVMQAAAPFAPILGGVVVAGGLCWLGYKFFYEKPSQVVEAANAVENVAAVQLPRNLQKTSNVVEQLQKVTQETKMKTDTVTKEREKQEEHHKKIKETSTLINNQASQLETIEKKISEGVQKIEIITEQKIREANQNQESLKNQLKTSIQYETQIKDLKKDHKNLIKKYNHSKETNQELTSIVQELTRENQELKRENKELKKENQESKN